ncbi:hypothetical protein NHF48_012600 [Sphingomonas sp. H160509]|uniref:hypothetical protein n=1 Tax=Sphingomonas sp. H160509 TaxID=2955313 RepID=UPI0021E76BAF|nr:hypothetical protein [Sphingomonas sp. H160509]MDD1451620.1 hypothetical protein [Sphingomonas sp. H160509]
MRVSASTIRPGGEDADAETALVEVVALELRGGWLALGLGEERGEAVGVFGVDRGGERIGWWGTIRGCRGEEGEREDQRAKHGAEYRVFAGAPEWILRSSPARGRCRRR